MDDDHTAAVVELEVADAKRQRLGDPQPAPDQDLGQGAVDV
jgi:hypothetical protein